MKTYFDEDRRPIAVDEAHPMDILEPEPPPPTRDLPDMLTIVETVAETFFRGTPRITQVSWRILLNKESRSMRACAARLDCTAQAISKRVRLLSERFGFRIPDRRLREMRRMAKPGPSKK